MASFMELGVLIISYCVSTPNERLSGVNQAVQAGHAVST
jgi:hypothetical protein